MGGCCHVVESSEKTTEQKEPQKKTFCQKIKDFFRKLFGKKKKVEETVAEEDNINDVEENDVVNEIDNATDVSADADENGSNETTKHVEETVSLKDSATEPEPQIEVEEETVGTDDIGGEDEELAGEGSTEQTTYQKKCFVKFGFENIDAVLDIDCKSLTKITVPASVISISDAPFRGCENMKSIKVEAKNMHYKSEPNKRDGNDFVLFNKNKSILIAYPANSREVQYDIPDSVTVISDWAFCDSKKLNRITMPDSVNEIGEGAFCNCTLLDEIEIPDSVVKIDDCVFRGCTSLDTVIIPDSVKDMGWGIFDGCEDKVVVYCNEGSLAQEYCRRNGIKEARIYEKHED